MSRDFLIVSYSDDMTHRVLDFYKVLDLGDLIDDEGEGVVHTVGDIEDAGTWRTASSWPGKAQEVLGRTDGDPPRRDVLMVRGGVVHLTGAPGSSRAPPSRRNWSAAAVP